jgi:hypothetical protein
MRRSSFAICLAGVILATVALPTRADAFCRSTTCRMKSEDCAIDEQGCPTVGTPIVWPRMPITYRFSARGSSLLIREEARAAIRAAFHRWSDTTCSDGRRTSLRFAEGEDVPDDKPLEAHSRGAEPFAIYFRDLGWPYATPDETLAQTNHTYKRSTGLIEYSDIEINSGARRFALGETTEGIDLQAVVTHEVGHYIGLAHSKEPDSIMAAGYCEVDAQRCEKGKVAARRLAADDIAAVCALFPPDARPADAESPAAASEAAGCNQSPPQNGTPSLAFPIFIAGALTIVLYTRRRPR